MISQLYLLVLIVVLAVLGALLVLVKRPAWRSIGPLAGLAFAFILAGMLFGKSRAIGYGLLGVGVLLALVDIIRRRRARETLGGD